MADLAGEGVHEELLGLPLLVRELHAERAGEGQRQVTVRPEGEQQGPSVSAAVPHEPADIRRTVSRRPSASGRHTIVLATFGGPTTKQAKPMLSSRARPTWIHFQVVCCLKRSSERASELAHVMENNDFTTLAQVLANFSHMR